VVTKGSEVTNILVLYCLLDSLLVIVTQVPKLIKNVEFTNPGNLFLFFFPCLKFSFA
jgi:hypothetical protein